MTYTDWKVGNLGTDVWFVFRDVRWTFGGVPGFRRECAEESRGRTRKFPSRMRAQYLADDLNGLLSPRSPRPIPYDPEKDDPKGCECCGGPPHL